MSSLNNLRCGGCQKGIGITLSDAIQKYWQNRGISMFVEVDFFPACGVSVSYSGPSNGEVPL